MGNSPGEISAIDGAIVTRLFWTAPSSVNAEVMPSPLRSPLAIALNEPVVVVGATAV